VLKSSIGKSTMASVLLNQILNAIRIFLLEFIVVIVVVVFLLLYFNRVFAAVVSYIVRILIWHRHQMYVDIGKELCPNRTAFLTVHREPAVVSFGWSNTFQELSMLWKKCKYMHSQRARHLEVLASEGEAKQSLSPIWIAHKSSMSHYLRIRRLGSLSV
jgi:hypothetical protein